jgi:hypothetical protein
MNEASCGSRVRRRQALILVAAVAGIVLLAACGGGSSGSSGAHASTYIYWANSNGSTIGRADLNGTGVNQRFITGADVPDGWRSAPRTSTGPMTTRSGARTSTAPASTSASSPSEEEYRSGWPVDSGP